MTLRTIASNRLVDGAKIDNLPADVNAELAAKQDTLVSGTNIKTINGTSVLGSGDITISGAVDSVNGQTGVVVLDADDIDDTSTTNKFVTSSDITKLGNLSGTNSGDVTVSDSSEIDFTLTGQQISASIVAGSIDETKLDASVNASLDLADSALQANQTITLSGDVTGSGTTGITTTIANGAVDIAMLSASGTPDGTTFLRGDNTWSVPAGAGNVSKVGTPVDNQIGVWTGDGTIEGDANLTFDTSTDTLTTVNTVLQTVKASGSAGVEIKNSGGTDVIITGAGGGTGTSIVGTTNIASASADYHQIAGGTGTITDTATGSSTDININLVPKGAGRLQAGGVNVPTISSTDTLTNKTLTSPVINTPTGIVKGDVGLGNVDNTSDSTKNSATATLTNKRITPRVGTTTSSATPTINTDDVDVYVITAQAVDITSFTTNLSGTPTSEQSLRIAITGTAARAITRGASFENGAVTLPTTTITTQRLDVQFIWNAATSKWRCMAAGPLS